MRRLKRFFLLLAGILILMGLVPVLVDRGFESFRLRPVLLTIGFMAIVVFAQVHIFERRDHDRFWQRFALAGTAVFFVVAGFSLAVNAILFDRITIWIAVSQGLVCNVFLLASILVTALLNKKASIRRSETPVTYLSKRR